jgi:NAD(P)-dependent dehydrogenase (short-subunit alcohol dehydrogenase family)
MILKDKTVMVAGIGPGLGVKLAINAAREGARVVGISCRTPAMLDDAERRIRAVAPACDVVKVKADLCSFEDGEAFAGAVIARSGRIDALLNSGRYGGTWNDDILTTDFKDWEVHFAVNTIGMLKMARAVIPQMKAQGGGSIVMINTNAAKTVGPGKVAGYGASKAALMNATRSLAKAVGPDNIRVNSIHPSWMWNEPVIKSLEAAESMMGSKEEVYKRVAEGTALKRVMTDDEVALAALFLASDYSVSMTGASLDTNGGEWMP